MQIYFKAVMYIAFICFFHPNVHEATMTLVLQSVFINHKFNSKEVQNTTGTTANFPLEIRPISLHIKLFLK